MTDVYVDILFLINLGMDALCLRLTADLLHTPMPRWRWLLASVLGGLYAVVALFLPMDSLPRLALDGAVCLLICLVALGKRHTKLPRLCLTLGVFLILSMVLGGVMTALYTLLNRTPLVSALSASEEDGLSAFLFLILAVAGGLATAWGGRVFRRSHATTACTLTVRLGYRQVTLTGMVDSGNLLHDPVGGKPVITVDLSAIAPLLSPHLQHIMTHRRTDLLQALPPDEGNRIRLIPTGTATGYGLLIAFLPDEIMLSPEGKDPFPVTALIAPTHLHHAPADAMVPTDLMT